MPERSEQQVISARGEAFVEGQLSEWVVNEQHNDYGLDYIVTVTDEQDTDNDEDDGDNRRMQDVSSDQFFIQLKSSSFDAGANSVHRDLDPDHISQYISQPIPVLLVIYDDTVEHAYWLPVQEYVWDELDDKNPDWQDQTQVRFRINRSRSLENLNRIETAVNRVQNRITRQHSWSLNIGDGLIFSPDDFEEIQHQIDNSRLEYKGTMLLAARQHLKRGDEEEARQSIAEVIEAPETDKATIKALLFQLSLRNFAVGDEAVEILDLAERARDIAAELGIKVDEYIAQALSAIAGLFICLEQRENLLMTDFMQNLDEPVGLPDEEYAGLRYLGEQELLEHEFGAATELNDALVELLDSNEYYAYAFVLSHVVDYLSCRLMIECRSPQSPIDIEPDEETEIHPLVDQATQLVDFVAEPELKFNLKKSIGIWHYHAVNAETARGFLVEARDLAREFDDEFLVEDTSKILSDIDEYPNPYDRGTDHTDDEMDLETVTKDILERQGFDVPDEIDAPEDEVRSTADETRDEDYDPFEAAIRHGIKDADPEEYYRHCEHLHLAYEPSMLGEMTGATSIGIKILWCKHGGGMESGSLTRMFEGFKAKHCEGCEYHSPRGDDWECTQEFADEHIQDPEFQEFLEQRDAALDNHTPGTE